MNNLSLHEILEKKRKEYNLPVFDIPDNYQQYKVDQYNSLKGNLNEADNYNCDICKNKGHIMYLENTYEYMKDCKCMRVRRNIQNLRRSGLEKIIKEFTLDKYETQNEWQKMIKEKAIKFIGENHPSFWWYIGGNSGAGKTHICTAIAREFLLKGKKVKYMLWKEDATAIKGSITDIAEYKSLLEPFKHAEVLYIDDLFKPIKDREGNILPPTQADVNLAFELLDYRKNSNLTTVISSERFLSELSDIDEAVGGRIAEKTTREYILSVKRDRSRNYRLKGLQSLEV